MRKLVVTALAAATLTCAFAAPAAAADIVTVKVGYSDLDLETASGQDTLKTRIAVAVKTACAKPDTRSLKQAQAWQNCKESAASSAAEQFEKAIDIASL